MNPAIDFVIILKDRLFYLLNPDDPLLITDDPKKGKMDRLFLKMDRLYSLITLKQTIYDRLFCIVPSL